VPVEPLRCTSAVILGEDARVFIQRRAPDRTLFPGAWDVVGGHLEDGESYTEALDREVYEETGWQVSHILAELGETRYTGDDGIARVEHTFLVRVEGDLNRPRLAPAEHTEWRWVTELEYVAVAQDGGPGDRLTGELLGVGFRAARAIGLI
jgi:8-oxo-dGTP diphosphatase